jgi:serine/threonine protein kinase
MAPEQAAGKRRDVRATADVYSLGAVLYELLTGQPPFRGETIVEILHKLQLEEPTPPRQRVGAVPRDLDTICLTCLHKDPTRRYESAEALADELSRYLRYEPILARPNPRWERALKWTRRHPIATTLLVVVFLLTLMSAGAGWWYWDTYNRVKVEHFANLVRRRGVPEGIRAGRNFDRIRCQIQAVWILA